MLRFGFMQRALQTEPDLELFRKPPGARLLFGVFCIGISYVIAWPSMTAITLFTAWLGRPWIGLAASPVLYGLSWVVWTAGLWLAGRDSLKYGRAFGNWALRRFAHRYLLR
jgi:hypothetical protein